MKIARNICVVIMMLASCNTLPFNENKDLDYCVSQADKTLQAIPADSTNLPRSIDH